ncbi:MAG TPA: hypothetical protein VHZ78_10655 [Rhizomicrobium sp.]|jgi:hypothetical protein|nr:hypothetical protein [Rhizomicrobium sp.]
MTPDEFSKIKFGFASAEAESAEDPGLLIEGFIELNKVFDQARSGSSFLFLGYKGTGKSAVGERLRLSAENNPMEFVRRLYLKDFPFTPFSKIVRGDIEPQAKFPVAWSWILLIYLVESFSRDAGLTHPEPERFDSAVKAFAEMGLSPVGDPASIVRTTTKNSFKLSVPKFLEKSWSGRELRPASEIPDFVDNLRELVRTVRSKAIHYLVIDGLDDILTSREVQYESLGALIFETDRLNQLFRQNFVPAKIIVACRTDLFERIAGANKNKVRQDYAIELDWYHNTRDREESLLLRIGDLRASRSLGHDVSVFDSFLTGKIDSTDMRTALLEMTRHTPRDFLQLMKNIQQFSKNRSRVDAIRSGMRMYSIQYFLPEIKDELSGYATSVEIEEIFDLMSRLRKRDFSLKELLDIAIAKKSALAPDQILKLLEILFECSAIGNIQHRRSGTTFYTFNYRNRHSKFNDAEGIMLHRGLWKALNLV